MAPGYSPYDDPEGWTPVGEGAHRAVILNASRTTVYKVETEAGSNRRESRPLSGLRDQGHTHAQPTTLWSTPCGTARTGRRKPLPTRAGPERPGSLHDRDLSGFVT